MNNYREPPNIDANKLDFSEFHPLDHHPWEQRCKEFYGGWRHHIKIDWEFRQRPAIEGFFGRLFCCWWGHHNPGQVWKRPKDWQPPFDRKDWEHEPWVTYQFCYWCFNRLSEDQPQ